MLQTFIRQLRERGSNGFLSLAKRLLPALLMALFLPAAALAYTVVMRDGRRMEIPQVFTVTRTTLTYEYAEGIYVTLQLANIDIAATERANNEASGSLLRRAEAQKTTDVARTAQSRLATRDASRASTARTITDSDLEKTRRTRLESEARYERRRRELGLPSLEESRRLREEEALRAEEEISRSMEDEAQAESYWRARASELRTAIAASEAEINYLRARLAETSDSRSTLSTAGFVSYRGLPYILPQVGALQTIGSNAIAPIGRARPVLSTSFSGARSATGSIAARLDFGGGSTRGRVLVNNRGSFGFPRRHPFTRRGFGFPPVVFGGVYANSYASYDRASLLTRLYELESEYVGLRARWQLLEDEARRAGAPPGWLRP